MRKMLCIIATVALILTMAIPCFAAEDDNAQVQPRSSGVRISGFDPNGNTYLVTGLCSGANSHTAMAGTTFSVAGWGEGGGEEDPLDGISQYISVDATVTFVGLSTNDYDDLDTSDYFAGEEGEVSDSQYYKATIASVTCIHYFSAGGNSSVSIATTG